MKTSIEQKSERTIIMKRKTTLKQQKTSIGRYTVNLVSARSARAEELHVLQEVKNYLKTIPKLYPKVSREFLEHF